MPTLWRKLLVAAFLRYLGPLPSPLFIFELSRGGFHNQLMRRWNESRAGRFIYSHQELHVCFSVSPCAQSFYHKRAKEPTVGTMYVSAAALSLGCFVCWICCSSPYCKSKASHLRSWRQRRCCVWSTKPVSEIYSTKTCFWRAVVVMWYNVSKSRASVFEQFACPQKNTFDRCARSRPGGERANCWRLRTIGILLVWCVAHCAQSRGPVAPSSSALF